MDFESLVGRINQVQDVLQAQAAHAINLALTARNWLVGYYIVEFEQNGEDRAKYGENLLKRLAEKVNKRGINETLLKVSRSFYINYPQIKDYLEGKSATPSHLSWGKNAMLSHKSETRPTLSNKFVTPAEKIISQLSFSHIREIMTVDDPFARFFYETECIRCCWSVAELRRQISTNP